VPGILTRGKKSDAVDDGRPVAVVDIGSNSIRLVVYESARRTPTPIFNEKVLCGLARGLNTTGRLSDEAVGMAHSSLARFRALTDAMGVARIHVVATAAVRDAANGGEFVAAVRDRCGFDVRILSGAEEARLSALGVLSGIPEADGLMGDLGGGSVELVRIGGGETGVHATLPLGPLRLADAGEIGVAKVRKIVDKELAGLSWRSEAKGKRFYPVGGAWRSLARVHMAHSGYPLHVIHQYTIRAKPMLDFTRLVSRLSPSTLRKAPGVSRQRADSIPYAAYLMQQLVEITGVHDIVFSAYGLREGCLYDRLPADDRRVDPLLAACRWVAERVGRATADGELLFNWMSPLFPGESPRQTRLRLAACHLADIGWSEHPDYRGEMVFDRILRHSTVGTDHPGRVFMALAVASRHTMLKKEAIREETGTLLSVEDETTARVVGMAMRLGYTFSGGVISLLALIRLRRDANKVTLSLPDHADILVGDVVERRFQALARLLSCEPAIEYYTNAGAVPATQRSA
jgi:exopolyphosphatase/guanosine-5'-triphosphate,3'-diphosphate pyrophosphatase